MWWEKKSQSTVPQGPDFTPAPPPIPILDKLMTETTPKQPPPTPPEQSQMLLGRTSVLQGQLLGNEDVLIEGEFEGTINLQDHCLTVGSHGQVKAEIHARRVIVHGAVSGNISARDKIEIRKTGRVMGDLVSPGIAIEDGAYFKGSIEILRDETPEVSQAPSTPTAEETLA